jgi:hypothetical protein
MMKNMDGACDDWKKAKELGLAVAEEYCLVCVEYKK